MNIPIESQILRVIMKAKTHRKLDQRMQKVYRYASFFMNILIVQKRKNRKRIIAPSPSLMVLFFLYSEIISGSCCKNFVISIRLALIPQ